MFSDNENPGADISAGQSATAATPAPENSTATTEPEASTPAAAQEQETPPVIPSSAAASFNPEPAAVTVAPAEPIAEPGGPAAVEHSDVSEALAVDAGEPSTESTSEMEQLMEQYAAPHQAPAEGEIESGQVVAITDLGVVVDLGGKTEGLIPAQEFAELDGPFPLQARAARGGPAHGRSQGWNGPAVLPASEAAARVVEDRRGLPQQGGHYRKSSGSHQGRPGR